MIADDKYIFSSLRSSNIVYQQKYCGSEGVISFIISPYPALFNGDFMDVSGINIKIEQTKTSTKLALTNTGMSIDLENANTYFVWIRWSKTMNIVEMSCAKYVHADMPLYKLQNYHYWFDIDNAVTKVGRYDIEMTQDTKGEIIVHTFNGELTNIKVFDIYVDNVSEILQMYPNNQHLLVNDTARKLIAGDGFINK